MESKRIEVERGIIEDRFGEILGRNSLDDQGKLVREYPLKELSAHVVGFVTEEGKDIGSAAR